MTAGDVIWMVREGENPLYMLWSVGFMLEKGLAWLRCTAEREILKAGARRHPKLRQDPDHVVHMVAIALTPTNWLAPHDMTN